MEAPKLKFDSSAQISDTELLELTLVEQAGIPAWCELVFPDMTGALYGKAKDLLGSVIRVKVDSRDEVSLTVLERRADFDPAVASETQLRLTCVDPATSLAIGPAFCNLGEMTLEACFRKGCDLAGLKAHWNGPQGGRAGQVKWNTVMYGETWLEMLHRHARWLGCALVPWRGALWLGNELPGAKEPVLKLRPWNRDAALSFWLDNRLQVETAPFKVLRSGVPVSLTGGKERTADDAEAKPGRSSDKSSGRNAIRDPRQSVVPAGGLFGTEEDASEFKKRLEQLRRWACIAGSVVVPWNLTECVTIGQKAEVRDNDGNEVVSELVVSGVTHRWRNGTGTRHIYLGNLHAPERLTDRYKSPVELRDRPAIHTWPAVVIGDYEPTFATIRVRPYGWATESEPLKARVGAMAASKLIAVRQRQKDELVEIRFEGGNPDFPLVGDSLIEHSALVPAREDVEFLVGSPDGKQVVSVCGMPGQVSLIGKDTILTLETNKFVGVHALGIALEASEGDSKPSDPGAGVMRVISKKQLGFGSPDIKLDKK